MCRLWRGASGLPSRCLQPGQCPQALQQCWQAVQQCWQTLHPESRCLGIVAQPWLSGNAFPPPIASLPPGQEQAERAQAAMNAAVVQTYGGLGGARSGRWKRYGLEPSMIEATANAARQTNAVLQPGLA